MRGSEFENTHCPGPGRQQLFFTKTLKVKHRVNLEVALYYTTNAEIDIDFIKGKLMDELPSYMLPSLFMELEEIPLNMNGKIDKVRLKKMSKVNSEMDIEDEVLAGVVDAFKEVLDADLVLVDDNFVEKAYYYYKKETRDYSLSLRDFASGDFDICREALDKAEKYAEEDIFYCLGSGPNFGLAYKLAMTMLMEGAIKHACPEYAAEFRHGLIERAEKDVPVIILWSDLESDEITKKAIDFCVNLEAKTIVYDLADYADVDKLLSPFILVVPLEWFVYYLAHFNGEDPGATRHIGKVRY